MGAAHEGVDGVRGQHGRDGPRKGRWDGSTASANGSGARAGP
ncbi:hypothetical protein ISF6_4135 [Piscinibacter sakaiensis]|uniref:Uncharacterized protein n=1 Tax=Piscinibacter sakaiensis TaxID=1547922 RepID=A0A0K8P5R0_PISS1|nr:hypothetical protein ISF6_4135 [Piscinibacter sakaiensis]